MYSLVYRVVYFSLKHKSPIRHSVFTYCEDELPSSLDLGKEQYGGPFTTEQVENGKVFLESYSYWYHLEIFWQLKDPLTV